MKQCGSSASITAAQRDDELRICKCDTRGVCSNHQRKVMCVRVVTRLQARFFQYGSPHIQEINPGLLLGPCTINLHCSIHLDFCTISLNARARAGCPKNIPRGIDVPTGCGHKGTGWQHFIVWLRYASFTQAARPRRLRCNSVDARQGIVLQGTISADHLCKHGLKLRAVI